MVKTLGFWQSVYRRAGKIIDASPGIDGRTAFDLALAQQEEWERQNSKQMSLTWDGLKKQLKELNVTDN